MCIAIYDGTFYYKYDAKHKHNLQSMVSTEKFPFIFETVISIKQIWVIFI